MKIKKWILPAASVLLAAALILLTCDITIVYDEKPQTQVNAQGETVEVVKLTFAEQYALDNWDGKILPAIQERAVDVATFVQEIQADLAAAGEKYGNRANETSPWSFCLKGKVKVLSVENPEKASQTRLLLDVAPYDGQADLKLQVSTVLKTNAIRDGVGFLKLDDFTNQVEFAELTKAFNSKVKESVLKGLDAKSLVGKEITLLGCVSTQKASLDDLLIIPVELQNIGGKKMDAQRQPVMQAKHITKVYPGTTALNQVDFDVWPGKVNVLIGENGAGKSTLMKILAGIEKPSEGSIFLEGQEVRFINTREASALGVGIIHQELNLFRDMKVVDNMFAGKELSHLGVIDRKAQYKLAKEVLNRLQQNIDPNEMMLNLRVGQQQVVEIAKTMLQQKLRVLIMDEPTSSLSNTEVEVLFKLIEDLKSQGIAIIYISHRLEEIIRIGDHVTILRDGNKVAEAEVKDISVPWIVQKMVGHSTLTIEKLPYPGEKTPLLTAENYTLPRLGGGYTVDHVSFTLHKGEVLGIYGLMGAGRTELVESMMGLHPESSGTLYVDGEKVEKPTVAGQISRGMVLVPEDRQKDGLVQTMSISSNLLLTSIPHFTRGVTINEQQCKTAVRETVKDMQVKVADVKHLITSLSGGNQQKVVIGKCVMAKAKVFMMDEPSRGIDVGAKTDIFCLMRRFAAQGMGVVFVGSELKEIVSVCDRVLVMSNGKLTADLSGEEITEDALVKASAAALNTGKSASYEGGTLQ